MYANRIIQKEVAGEFSPQIWNIIMEQATMGDILAMIYAWIGCFICCPSNNVPKAL